MKILLVTIVDNSNIGTCLQALATVSKLEELNNDVTVLYYVRKYLFNWKYALDLYKDRNIIIKELFAIFYVLICFFSRNIVVSFLKKHNVKVTKKYVSITKLKNTHWNYDLFITGSDQCWNCEHNTSLDEVFFLNFTTGRKISYATSIGTNEFQSQYISYIKRCLRQYDNISVRESQAVKVLNNLSFENVTHVLDPTMLLSKEEWREKLRIPRNQYNKSYVLVYSVEKDNNKIIETVSKIIARRLNLSIYYVSSTRILSGTHWADKVFENISPELFVSLFYYCKYSIVSSFHGTAFAINFNKQFVSVSPKKYNNRVVSILEQFDLVERLIYDATELPFGEIDFSKVNEKLIKYRNESMSFIKLCTNECRFNHPDYSI